MYRCLVCFDKVRVSSWSRHKQCLRHHLMMEGRAALGPQPEKVPQIPRPHAAGVQQEKEEDVPFATLLALKLIQSFKCEPALRDGL